MATATITRPDASTRRNPPVVTVFRAHDGSLGHTRCSRSLRYLGARGGGRELDFYCQHCHEHVTLPQIVILRMLEGDPVAAARRRARTQPAAVLAPA